MHSLFSSDQWGRQLWEEVRDTAKLNFLEKWIVMMWSGFELGQGGVHLFSGQLLKLEYLQKLNYIYCRPNLKLRMAQFEI